MAADVINSFDWKICQTAVCVQGCSAKDDLIAGTQRMDVIASTDPDLAEAHLAVAVYRMYYEWDFEGAEAVGLGAGLRAHEFILEKGAAERRVRRPPIEQPRQPATGTARRSGSSRDSAAGRG